MLTQLLSFRVREAGYALFLTRSLGLKQCLTHSRRAGKAHGLIPPSPPPSCIPSFCDSHSLPQDPRSAGRKANPSQHFRPLLPYRQTYPHTSSAQGLGDSRAARRLSSTGFPGSIRAPPSPPFQDLMCPWPQVLGGSEDLAPKERWSGCGDKRLRFWCSWATDLLCNMVRHCPSLHEVTEERAWERPL